jgi:hypothetical protein
MLLMLPAAAPAAAAFALQLSADDKFGSYMDLTLHNHKPNIPPYAAAAAVHCSCQLTTSLAAACTLAPLVTGHPSDTPFMLLLSPAAVT